MRFISFAAFALGLAALIPEPAAAQTGLQFIPVTPCRVVDTRSNATQGPEMGANSTRAFQIAGNCGIPSSAAAYSLNVTVVPDSTLGFLTMWPTGQPQPNASTLNSLDGRIKANAAIIPAGQNGSVSVYVTNSTQVVIDIDGYFVPDGTPNALQFYPVTPCRVADTRTNNQPILGGTSAQFNPLSSTCNIPSNAQAYSLNITAVPHGTLGFITVWPSGQNQPLVSTLNALTGAITANAAIVPAGNGGNISVYASNDTDLVIDIDGYFAPPGNTGGEDFFTLNPCRVLDTRNNNGQPFNGTLVVNVAGSNCGAPAPPNADAYVFNATVVPPGVLGFLTLWPDGSAQPLVSTLNALDGAITSNMAIVPTSNGSIDAFGSNPTQLVLDISGYFGPFGGTGGNCPGSACPPPPPCNPNSPCATIDNASVGANLQTLVNINLSPAPTGNVNVTVFTDNPALVAIAGSASSPGSSTFTYTQDAGTSTTAVEIQGLGGAGTAHIWAVVAGGEYGSSIGTVSLFPAAFVLQGPGGIGGSFVTGENAASTLTVLAGMLDTNNNYVTNQEVRGGFSVPVSLSVVNPSLGSVSPASVTFTGGSNSQTTSFTAGSNSGSTTIIANEPGGFVNPANNANQNAVTVQPPTLSCTSGLAVGYGLTAPAQCSITGAVAQDTVVTITSSNPSALLLTGNANTTGSASIQETIAAGTSATAVFYLIGNANSGTANLNVTSSLGNFTESVQLLQTAFVIQGPLGIGGTLPVAFPGQDVPLTIETAQLSGSGNPLFVGAPLAPGFSATVNVTSSNGGAGTIIGSPITIPSGVASGSVSFHPTGVGSTTVSAAATNSNFSSGTGSSLGVTVNEAKIFLTPPALPLGQNLEEQGQLLLTGVPTSNLNVILSSSGAVKFSATGTDAGANPLTLTIPAGQQSAIFYIYGAGNSGTAQITAAAGGYQSGNGAVQLGPSGFVIEGPFGVAPVLNTSAALGSQPLTIAAAVLDSGNNFSAIEGLAGNLGASVTVNLGTTGPGSTSPSSVVVPVGTPGGLPNVGTATFTPTAQGTAVVSIPQQPAGFSTPVSNSTNPGPSLTINLN